MGLLLLAAFIAVPLIEIAVFIQVGGLIGLWPTLAIVIVTAVAGTWLLRLQGIATLNRARQQMDRGVMPARELFDGLCLVFAGALLLTPGFVTDAVGLALFVPPLRDALRRAATRYVETHATTRVYTGPGGGPGAGQDEGRDWREAAPPPQPGRGWGPRGRDGATTIEGDYRDLTERPEAEAQDGPEERRNDRPGPRSEGTDDEAAEPPRDDRKP